MINPFAKQLLDDISEHFSTQSSPIDKHQLSALIESLMGKFNLVTRDEFDTQTAILARTREKVDALEKQLNDAQAMLTTLASDNTKT